MIIIWDIFKIYYVCEELNYEITISVPIHMLFRADSEAIYYCKICSSTVVLYLET